MIFPSKANAIQSRPRPRPIILSSKADNIPHLEIEFRPGLVQADNISVQGRQCFRPRPMIFPSKADNIYFLRIGFRPGLVQGRDGIQFLADDIWTMDDNIAPKVDNITPKVDNNSSLS